MNGPGLDEPIQEQVREAERSLEEGIEKPDGKGTSKRQSGGGSKTRNLRERFGGEEEREEDKAEKALGQPNMWWITSTAFPLMAAAFGPLASLTSVCALVQPWRLRIPPGGKKTEARGVGDPAWYTSSFLLIALVAAAPKHLQLYPRQEHAFSQSYYYGILSSTLYFIVATFLLTNYFNSVMLKRYPPIFSTPTLPQRALMLQTISLTFYLGVGALVFSKIEGWEYVNAVYWADYTILTVGLGSDFKLEKTLSRALLIPYAIGGIIILGLVVDSVRSLVLERGKIKVKRRAIEKERTKWVGLLEERRREQGSSSQPKSEEEKLRDEFYLMRKIERTANTKSKWTSLATSLTAVLFLWLGGAMVFTFSERPQKWSYFDSLYFSYVTLLTIGYGDLYPESNSGKPFFVVWTMIAVPALTILISNMGSTVVGMIQKATLWVGAMTILPGSDSRISLARKLKPMKRTKEEIRLEKSPVTAANTFPGKVHGLQEEGKQGQLLQLLAVEIRTLTKDMTHEPPRNYSFEEWVRFLGLLGVAWKEEDTWSWLDEGSPLASSSSETEWLLDRMCQRLEGDIERLGEREKIRDTQESRGG